MLRTETARPEIGSHCPNSYSLSIIVIRLKIRGIQAQKVWAVSKILFPIRLGFVELLGIHWSQIERAIESSDSNDGHCYLCAEYQRNFQQRISGKTAPVHSFISSLNLWWSDEKWPRNARRDALFGSALMPKWCRQLGSNWRADGPPNSKLFFFFCRCAIIFANCNKSISWDESCSHKILLG